MAIVAAAVCPHPPLLIPMVGVGVDIVARNAALNAVSDLVAAGPDLVIVVGSGPEVATYTPSDSGSLAGFGVKEAVPLGPRVGSGVAVLPLSITVGAWLLREVGWTGDRQGFAVPQTLPAEAAAGYGRELAELEGRVALLCMGDASARRSRMAPGWLDPRAEAFDAYAATALANADCEALLRLDPALARELLVAGRASWQILAGAAAGRSWCSRLLCDEAPFGVGYLVATWTTEGMTLELLAIVGPTGAGKSELAIELALRIGGEIVNADSMQLYRGMDIGTAKLTAAEQRGVPHHLLDIWEVSQAADVARYQALARATIDRIRQAGRVPVLVGGSGLYVRAVLDDLRFPGTDASARAALEHDLARVGPGALHARLSALDPAAAAAILPSNGRRIVRALEVVGLRGSFSASLPDPRPIYDALQIGIDRPDLDARLALRTRRMFASGLVDEVRALEQRGLRDGRTASRALGYTQVLTALDQGPPGSSLQADALVRAEEGTERATRRFARRQRSWFRRDPAVRWLSGAADGRGRPPGQPSADDVSPGFVTTALDWWTVSPQ